MLKLFYSPGSCATASHIALEEAGADYEAVRVDVLGGEQTRPGYLAINVNMDNASKFCLIDTNRKVICVYNLNGSKMRLVSARKFDHDAEIVDSSVTGVQTSDGKGVIAPWEGQNGLSRKLSKDYAEGLQKLLEKAK